MGGLVVTRRLLAWALLVLTVLQSALLIAVVWEFELTTRVLLSISSLIVTIGLLFVDLDQASGGRP